MVATRAGHLPGLPGVPVTHRPRHPGRLPRPYPARPAGLILEKRAPFCAMRPNCRAHFSKINAGQGHLGQVVAQRTPLTNSAFGTWSVEPPSVPTYPIVTRWPSFSTRLCWTLVAVTVAPSCV